MGKGKIIIISAPSGCGKSTVIRELLKRPELRLGFSISATSRPPRGGERHGREYYFLSPEDFSRRVEQGDFVEWEEVYPGRCYGTLRAEVERVTGAGMNLIMDVDVKGGVNIKKEFGDRALSIFLLPPSLEILESRLRGRGDESEDQILTRLKKAEYEISFSPEFDHRVVNGNLSEAVEGIASLIDRFSNADPDA